MIFAERMACQRNAGSTGSASAWLRQDVHLPQLSDGLGEPVLTLEQPRNLLGGRALWAVLWVTPGRLFEQSRDWAKPLILQLLNSFCPHRFFLFSRPCLATLWVRIWVRF